MSVLPIPPFAADLERTTVDGPASSCPAVDALPAKIGPYAVIERLGRGGMGEVFAVRDHRFARELALKRLAPYPSLPELEECFAAELRITASLAHPSIVPIHDHGEDHGQPYFVMQRVRGPSLDALLASDDPVSIETRLEIFLQICDAVAHAHSRGVLHLDLKPANILLGEGKAVYVLDWGIAFDGQARLRHNFSLGTPGLMAPEQVRRLFSTRPRVMFIRRHVPVARIADFEQWFRKLLAMLTRFPGHQGVTLLRGSVDRDRGTREFMMLGRFASPEDMRRFDLSPERAALIGDADQISGGPADRVDASGERALLDIDLCRTDL